MKGLVIFGLGILIVLPLFSHPVDNETTIESNDINTNIQSEKIWIIRSVIVNDMFYNTILLIDTPEFLINIKPSIGTCQQLRQIGRYPLTNKVDVF